MIEERVQDLKDRITGSLKRAYARDPEALCMAYEACIMAMRHKLEPERVVAVERADDVGSEIIKQFGPETVLPWWMRTSGTA